jgi:hypothetical protein
MALTKVQPGLLEATGTPSASTFLRGDGAWSTTLTSGTAVTASGTSVDFTGIPSTAKRITVMFSGVSTNGSSNVLIQLGDSGGIENTGYNSACGYGTGAGQFASSTIGLITDPAATATALRYGSAIISLLGSNTWASQSCVYSPTIGSSTSGSGAKTLSDTLTQVRITTVNGTDTFDAGTINIMWE